jgi:hypothetical protein
MKRLFALLMILLVTAASATTVKPLTIEQLTAEASVVVEGQAAESWSTWNTQHSLIYTFTRVRVTKALKGQPADTVLLKQVGGSANGYTQHVAGVNPMKSGDTSVLFLRPSGANDGTMVIVGLMQGNFRIQREPSGSAVVNNAVDDVHLSSANGVTQYRGAKMTLRQLEARVQKAANE